MNQTNRPERPEQQTPWPLMVRLHAIPAGIAAVGAVLVFHLPHFVTPFVDSYDFCENTTVTDISTWIFPKLVKHCDLITNTGLRDHSRSDIAIMLDVYIVIVFFILLINTVRIYLRLSPSHWNYARNNIAKSTSTTWGRFILRVSIVGVAGMVAFTLFLLFVFSNLATPPGAPIKSDTILDSSVSLVIFIFACCYGTNFFVLILAINARIGYSRPSGHEIQRSEDCGVTAATRERTSMARRTFAYSGRGSILGWIGFVLLSLLWPPVWFGGFIVPTPGSILFGVGLGLIASACCALIRMIGYSRAAWATLACLVAVTALWSLATGLGDGPDDLWAGHYQIFVLGMTTMNMAVILLFIHLLRRRSNDIRSRAETGDAS